MPDSRDAESCRAVRDSRTFFPRFARQMEARFHVTVERGVGAIRSWCEMTLIPHH